MQSFDFSLQAVLSYYERKKMLTELQLHRTLQALLSAQAETQQLRQELDGIAAAMEQSIHDHAQTPWDCCQARTQQLAKRIAIADEKTRAARLEFAKAHETHKELATRCEALSELKQRRWQQFRDLHAVHEQRRIDEFVLRHWVERAKVDNPDNAQRDNDGPEGKESP